MVSLVNIDASTLTGVSNNEIIQPHACQNFFVCAFPLLFMCKHMDFLYPRPAVDAGIAAHVANTLQVAV